MKTVKRALALVLALTIILTLSIGAFAANGYNGDNGTITINNAIKGQTYTIYQILTLESYSTENEAYSYKATAAWKTFVESDAIKDKYLKTDGQGYVTWVDGASAAEFAALAQAYAKEHSITNQGSAKAETTTVEFTGLNLGYYLLDSSLGTLCSLDTTNPTVTIQEKNQEPTNTKQVEEDSTGTLGEKNDADIGQMVKFVSEVTLPAGSENVVFHDKMSAGLTLYEGLNAVIVYADADLKTAIPDGNYKVTAKNNADGCTLEIDFSGTIGLYDKVYVVYYATVNENAVVGGEGNPNESHLSYGEDGTTTTVPSKTTTYTWSFDVLKYGNSDESKTLEGAQFVLLNNDKTKVATVVNGKLTGWADVPTDGADGAITWPENTILTTDANGKLEVAGLDGDTYYLREVKAPAGYNVLDKDVEVKIAPTVSEDGKTLTLTPVTVKVNNKSGAELPSTGGIGTTVFYVLGGLLVVCAGVLLITKRRMNKNA